MKRARPSPTRTPRPGARRAAGEIAAVRGAIQVRADRADEIREATARLLRELVRVNRLEPRRIVSAIFTTTSDLTADFPAHAARRLGWTDVPLLGATEMPVPGSLARVVRVLLTVRGVRPGARLVPVYLEGAEALRPDLAPVVAMAKEARPPVRVAIIGLGQIGGSIALALKRAGGWHVTGFDLDPRAIRAARRAGALDAAARTLEAACAGAAIAVVATPVDTLPALLARAARALPRGAVLLDTGSARGRVTRALAAAAAAGVRAVGGHPIAGNEGRGFAAARADLFAGSPFALLPVGRGVPAPARRLVRALGARALVVGAAAHDRALARTSHLPWLLSRALAEAGARHARTGLAGPGWRGMTRLAASDPRVAGAYVRENAREVRAAWREVEARVRRQLRGLGGGARSRER